MITMVDEIYDRMFQENRAQLSRDFGQLFSGIGREIGKSLKAMHQFEWNAPWAIKAKASKDVGCA
jgi:hypothetical protein